MPLSACQSNPDLLFLFRHLSFCPLCCLDIPGSWELVSKMMFYLRKTILPLMGSIDWSIVWFLRPDDRCPHMEKMPLGRFLDKRLPLPSRTPVGCHRQLLVGCHPRTLSSHFMECLWHYCLTCALPGRMQDWSISWSHRALVKQLKCPLRHFHLWLDETVLLGSVQGTMLPSAKISVLVTAEQIKHWGPIGRLLLQWHRTCNSQGWDCQQTDLS